MALAHRRKGLVVGCTGFSVLAEAVDICFEGWAYMAQDICLGEDGEKEEYQ